MSLNYVMETGASCKVSPQLRRAGVVTASVLVIVSSSLQWLLGYAVSPLCLLLSVISCPASTRVCTNQTARGKPGTGPGMK